MIDFGAVADRMDNAGGGRWATPGELAAALDPATVQTEALEVIDRALVDVYEGRCPRLIVSLPPQEGKSTRVTRYGPLWMLSRNPDLRIGIVSYGDDLARDFSYLVRNDIATFDGTDDTVDIGLRLRDDTRAAGRWSLASPAKGGVYAVGIGGALTGKPLDMLFIDDPVKDYRNADSEVQSEAAWQWWMSVARPRLAPGAPVVLIMTRWSEKDLAGRLLTKQAEDEAQLGPDQHFDRWRVVNIPALADHDPGKGETDPLGRQPGEWLASSRRRTTAQWEATRASLSARVWAALYQGRPSPDSGGVFERHWWRQYPTPIWSQTPSGAFHVDCDEMLMSWDLTFKDTKGSDFVVGQVWARRGVEAYLVDQVHQRLSFVATIAAIRRMVQRWPQATTKLVEDKANGTAVIEVLRKEIGGIVPVTPTESKYARASAISPFVEAGNVLLPDPRWSLFKDVDGFVDEAAAFPNGAHDDQVDAMTQALARLSLRMGGGMHGAAYLGYMKRMAETDGREVPSLRRNWREVAAELNARRRGAVPPLPLYRDLPQPPHERTNA